ncbi:hypothetical protein M0R45_035529 [Rubus argutus]|uniref:Uncharacterized protein n=1 Tax=Rubus argutus TaxID=59490 RepID=A0AAW1VXM9_RUBAR
MLWLAPSVWNAPRTDQDFLSHEADFILSIPYLNDACGEDSMIWHAGKSKTENSCAESIRVQSEESQGNMCNRLWKLLEGVEIPFEGRWQARTVETQALCLKTLIWEMGRH